MYIAVLDGKIVRTYAKNASLLDSSFYANSFTDTAVNANQSSLRLFNVSFYGYNQANAVVSTNSNIAYSRIAFYNSTQAQANQTLKFGIGFVEASGPRLVRGEGNNHELEELAKKNAFAIGAGHSFVILFKEAFPINVANAIKHVPEVSRIFCATANPVQVIIGTTNNGKSILGIVDGGAAKGIEADSDKKERREFLRKIGYKL